MYSVQPEILEKHKEALEAARKYWVLNQPTGMLDHVFNQLELAARQDGLELRDYVTQELQGTRAKNADYVEKVEKNQVTGSMLEAVRAFQSEHPEVAYWIPKYDGSSLGAYYDTKTGRCVKVITIGGSNLNGLGIDQTEKFAGFFPDIPGSGIMMIQAECLVSLEHGFGENSRQKANGLVNSSYEPLAESEWLASGKGRTQKQYQGYLKKFKENLDQVKREVSDYINIRGFRYYTEPGFPGVDYKAMLESLPAVWNDSGDLKFAPGYVMTMADLEALGPEVVEKDIWATPTGTFLVDGLVAYTADGHCVKALKYKDAGRGEAVRVQKVQWNNQIKKGKDSWSANAIVDPIEIRGSVITKPSMGSVKKMVTGNISPGALVTLILANSTIPAISEVLEPGNGDFSWPVCSCGYQMDQKDTFGSLLKCGNPMCTERLERMRKYLGTCKTPEAINPDKLLIIDRTKLTEIPDLMVTLVDGIRSGVITGPDGIKAELEKTLKTDLQRRNIALVVGPAFVALSEWITSLGL